METSSRIHQLPVTSLPGAENHESLSPMKCWNAGRWTAKPHSGLMQKAIIAVGVQEHTDGMPRQTTFPGTLWLLSSFFPFLRCSPSLVMYVTQMPYLEWSPQQSFILSTLPICPSCVGTDCCPIEKETALTKVDRSTYLYVYK